MKETTTVDSEKMRELKMELCPSVNARTDEHSLYVTFYRTNRLFKQAFKFACDILQNPICSEEIMKTERGVINEEYNRAVDAKNHNINRFEFFNIAKCPSLEKSLGTLEDLNKITREDLLDFNDKHFTSNNFFVSYCGNLGKRTVVSLINNYILNNLREDATSKCINEDVCVTAQPNLFICTNDQNSITAKISYKFDADANKERNKQKYFALRNVFMSNKNCFFQKMRSKGLVYTSSANFGVYNGSYLFSMVFKTSKDKMIECFNVVNETIKYVLTNDISEDFIKIYKNNDAYFEDEKEPLSKDFKMNNNIYLYKRDKEFRPMTKKEHKKNVMNLTTGDVKDAGYIFFGNGQKPYITIMSNLTKEELPTYEELCAILNNGLDAIVKKD